MARESDQKEKSVRKKRTRPLEPSLDDLDLYRKVCAALRLKSVHSLKDAAKVLERSESFVSETITALVELCKVDAVIDWQSERGRPSLTEEGKRLLKRAEELLRQHRELPQVVQGSPANLVIAASNAFIRVCLPQIIRDYYTKTPSPGNSLASVEESQLRANLRFVEQDSTQMMLELRAGNVEVALGVAYTETDYPGFPSYSLNFSVERVLVAPIAKRFKHSKAPVPLSSLGNEVVCLLADDEHTLRDLGLPDRAGSRRIVVEHYSSILPLVRANVGVGIVPTAGNSLLESEGIDPAMLVTLAISPSYPQFMLKAWTAPQSDRKSLRPAARWFLEVLTAFQSEKTSQPAP